MVEYKFGYYPVTYKIRLHFLLKKLAYNNAFNYHSLGKQTYDCVNSIFMLNITPFYLPGLSHLENKGKYEQEERLLGPVSVAAYSYMSLVPIIQPPIMRFLTTKKERAVKMDYPDKKVSKTVKILFPIIVTLVTCLIAPMGTALMGMIMLGNLMKESGVVSRLTKASENEIANVVTLLLGLTIGGTMEGVKFLNFHTLLVLLLGLIAICFDTVAGVLFGKLMYLITKGKINPLIGAAGISAYPMAARVVQTEGRKYDTNNWLLMHAMGANTGGQVGSVMAAAIMLSVLTGLGII